MEEKISKNFTYILLLFIVVFIAVDIQTVKLIDADCIPTDYWGVRANMIFAALEYPENIVLFRDNSCYAVWSSPLEAGLLGQIDEYQESINNLWKNMPLQLQQNTSWIETTRIKIEHNRCQHDEWWINVLFSCGY